MSEKKKPSLHTILSPSLLHLYDVRNAVVVIIDVLRATSTMAAALENGAKSIIPVDSVAECIRIGKQIDAITAGERDGQVAEGLQHGNSPFEYPREFIQGKTLVLTTTNGTKLLHMALDKGATDIITGSFNNLDAVCAYLTKKKKPIILACAAWKDKVNMEDSLFAGAVIHRLRAQVSIQCDASRLADTLFAAAGNDLFAFMEQQQASHYLRLMSFGLEKDIRHCLTPNTVQSLPLYENGKLINAAGSL